MTLLAAAKAVITTRKAFQKCLPEHNEKWIKLHQDALDVLEQAVQKEEARKVVPLTKGKSH